MSNTLAPHCLVRFSALPNNSGSSRASPAAEEPSLATIRAFLAVLAEWEPGLADIIAVIVLDQLTWAWIPPSPWQPAGRLAYRDVLYGHEHPTGDDWTSDGFPIDEWCPTCHEPFASINGRAGCPRCHHHY